MFSKVISSQLVINIFILAVELRYDRPACEQSIIESDHRLGCRLDFVEFQVHFHCFVRRRAFFFLANFVAL